MQAGELRVEYRVEPLGIDTTAPRFSWVVTSERRGDRQSAYQVVVSSARGDAAAGVGDLWDSGRVASGDTAHVVYDGTPLVSDKTYWWNVRVLDSDGAPGPWSTPSRWDTGLLDPTEWTASWITAPATVRAPVAPLDGVDLGGRTHGRPPWLRGDFELPGTVRRARAFVTARGVYELYVNGSRVGTDVFSPGWTDYSKRIQYQVYDITSLLVPGANAAAALLGDGWYCGRVAWQQHVYGDHPSFLFQLHVELEDGSTARFGSDGSWTAAPSELLWSDMLTGEAQLVTTAPSASAATAATGASEAFEPVEVEDSPEAELVAQRGPTVRRVDELPAIETTELAPGRFLVDFGQNMVGWVRLRLPSSEDATRRVVTVRHAEMLDSDRRLYTKNLRAAQCTDAYVIEGAVGDVVVEPHFTWRGFRYAEIEGLASGVVPDATAVVVGSDTPWVGSFECSSEMVNQLQRNIEWGQRGNFLDVPMDCPQRDERLGWMGDAQIFIPTACWNADVAGFFTKWLDDVLDAQAPNGAFADVAPLVRADMFAEAAPAWGDAGVIVPWVLYERYGDQRLLERCFDAMVAWVGYIHEANPDLLWRYRRNLDYGDWLSVGEDTPRDLLATAYFAHSADLVGRAARVLGRKEDADHHEQLFREIKGAFNDAYVSPAGRIVGHTQTAYVMALAFDLLPDDKRAAACRFLVEQITGKRGFKSDFEPGHLVTGFLGVGHALPVLTEHGEVDLAYRLLENETYPSWGYSIRQGATTIWERWDGWTEERGFQDSGMNSFNHYSLGSVGHWLFSTVAGITPDPAAPAFEHFTVRPRPGGSLAWARATHRSLRGVIAAEWRLDEDGIEMQVVVPANCTAEVWVPGASVSALSEGGQPVAEVDGVDIIGDRDGFAVVAVGGGSYVFSG